ncbi:MAG: NapC/NirT family cytochrome c [Selenomonas sp.]|uniref:cytochrome c3 family protein n=1 Tax=Selenomonas sp. TaxID=2053611 RepID=UPI0025D6587E|nr:NapC/NirT family cytochrome c [Selenomonas sp.]MCR5756303.1 NapC/NirT family cytochrome c [Selenomonas sp.]
MSLLDKKFKLKHIAIAGFACIALLGATVAMIEATNQSSFCGTTCHEMDPMYQTWLHSGHKNVGCAECHEKPGIEGTIASKWQGTQELFLHVTGQVPDPIKMENPQDKVNCYTCHQDKIMNTEIALKNKDPHTAKHFENGMNCMTCHSGVVHNDAVNMELPSRDRCYTCHLDAMSKL